MGYKLASRVYGLDRELTSPSEHAVLLALAFRANDDTLLCYPKQETIVQMTHLSRSAVAAALNSLRKKNLINWRSGGLKNRKGKLGKTLANDYVLNLPAEPRKAAADFESDFGSGAAQPQVPSDSFVVPPLKLPPAVAMAAVQPRPRPARSERPNPAVDASPLLMALHICGLETGTREYSDNYRAFSSVMVKLGMERSMDIVRAIASEASNGELDKINSIPRFVMSRLKAAVCA